MKLIVRPVAQNGGQVWRPADRVQKLCAFLQALLTFALIGVSPMERYMPLTGIDLIPASLLIDTQAPLDVLQAMADYRIRTVTQVLENIAFRAEIGCDTVVLSDFSKLLAIPLRDGCDLMDVIGRRLRAQVAE
jgi:hypothetical protein